MSLCCSGAKGKLVFVVAHTTKKTLFGLNTIVNKHEAYHIKKKALYIIEKWIVSNDASKSASRVEKLC